MEKIDIEEISRLRNTISTNMKFTVNEYKSKSRGLNSRLESIMRQYSEYSDVTSRAREIQRMLSDIEKGANTIEKSSEKITNGLKSVVSLVKAEEQESKAIIKDNTQKIIKVKMNDKDVTTKAIGLGKIKVNTIRPEDALLGYPILNDLKETTITHEVGEENFIWKAIETIFTKENVEKLALMWQNAFIIEEQKRAEELQVLKNRLEESGLEPLTDEEIGFYNQLPNMLREMGTGLTPEQQRSLMSCLHIKGNVEEIDLKRIGVTGKDLKSMSESITLKYDSEYYNDLKDEKRKNQLGLIADFMNDTLQSFSDHAVALGEATVTTGVEIVHTVPMQKISRMV